MNGNTSAKVSDFSQTIISAVPISSLGISDTPLNWVAFQILSMIRSFSPTSKSQKRVFYEIAWTSVVYLSQMHCTHWGPVTVQANIPSNCSLCEKQLAKIPSTSLLDRSANCDKDIRRHCFFLKTLDHALASL